jgi:hypothetical protein
MQLEKECPECGLWINLGSSKGSDYALQRHYKSNPALHPRIRHSSAPLSSPTKTTNFLNAEFKCPGISLQWTVGSQYKTFPWHLYEGTKLSWHLDRTENKGSDIWVRSKDCNQIVAVDGQACEQCLAINDSPQLRDLHLQAERDFPLQAYSKSMSPDAHLQQSDPDHIISCHQCGKHIKLKDAQLHVGTHILMV